jgi:HK97 family phage prohead protease
MTQMVRKVFDAALRKGAGGYTVTLSTGNEDRIGERIRPQGWKFRPTVPLLWAHQPSELPIGRVRNIRVEGNALVGALEFPPPGTYDFADQVRDLVDAGFLGTVSVGFRVLQGPRDGWTYYEQELLELSAVNIPALPDATIGARADTEAIRKWLRGSGVGDDPVLELACEDEPLIYVDRAELAAATRAALTDLVKAETLRALNAIRGRID